MNGSKAVRSGSSRDLAREILRLLEGGGLTLSAAESCTGGAVSEVLTAVPGASRVFVGGGVTYSDRLKVSLLGVPEAVLQSRGAVSEACVRAMAEGARRVFGTDLAVAISGVAGPGGGTLEKPVGTVHLAVSSPAGTVHRLLRLRPPRSAVRRAAVRAALELLLQVLARSPKPGPVE